MIRGHQAGIREGTMIFTAVRCPFHWVGICTDGAEAVVGKVPAYLQEPRKWHQSAVILLTQMGLFVLFNE